MTVFATAAAFLLLLLLSVPALKVGIRIRYTGQLLIQVKAGPVTARIFPLPKWTVKRDVGTEKKGQEKKRKKAKTRQITFDAVRQLILDCVSPLLDSMGRVGSGLRVHRLTLHLTLGGEEDPAAAAQRYGQLHAVTWPLLAAAEQIVPIQRRDIHYRIDFSAPQTHGEGEVYLTLRIHHLIRIAVWNGPAFVRAFLRFWKAAESAPAHTASDDIDAAESYKIKTGNGKGR